MKNSKPYSREPSFKKNPTGDDIMKIKVKFFASYKEAVGTDELDLDMEDVSYVSQLLEAV